MIEQILEYRGETCPIEFSKWIGHWQVSITRRGPWGARQVQVLCYARTEQEAQERLERYLKRWHPEQQSLEL